MGVKFVKIKNISNKLTVVYDNRNQAQQVTYWLLEKLLQQTQAQIMVQQDLKLTIAQALQLDEWLKQLVEDHKPLQYILGSVPFLDLDILVQEPILIPRPETEWWVDELLQKLVHLKNKPLRILDMCSGSGCIALSFAKFFTNSQIVAADISKDACALIKKNIAHNQIENVVVVESDLFTNIEKNKFDLIVSNPPYIPADNYQGLDLSVRMWEDRRALVAPDNDLNIIKKIIKLSPKYLQQKHADLPQLWLEIDETQGVQVQKLMQNSFDSGSILKDQFGKERVVVGK
jgi:release factor glutamine methyltransferase